MIDQQLSDSIVELQNIIGGDTSTINTLISNVNTLTTNVTNLTTVVNGHTSNLTTINGEITTINGQIVSIENQIGGGLASRPPVRVPFVYDLASPYDNQQQPGPSRVSRTR